MIGSIFRRGALLLLLWWVLAEGRADSWPFGLLAVAFAVWASLRLSPPGQYRVKLPALFAFIVHFIWHSVLGGLQVARLAFMGRRALSPAVIEVTLNLPPGLPRLLMVNTIGLMPGTLGVELDETRLRLHVLAERSPALAEAALLEKKIAAVFGLTA